MVAVVAAAGLRLLVPVAVGGSQRRIAAAVKVAATYGGGNAV